MSALRAAAYAKPVVVMKVLASPAGSARRADAFGQHRRQRRGLSDAALRRAGVVRARCSRSRSRPPCPASRFRPVGKRLAIVSNGGGPGVVAADWGRCDRSDVAQLAPSREALKPQLRHCPALTA